MSKKPALREAIMDQVWYSFDRTYACLSFRCGDILLPVWVSGNSAVHLEHRLLRPPNRPEGIDLLFDRIEDIGVEKVAITGYSDGVFYSTVFLVTRRVKLVNYMDVTSVKVELQSCRIVLLCTK